VPVQPRLRDDHAQLLRHDGESIGERLEPRGRVRTRVDSRTVARKRVQFRPPGLKPTTKVGTLGPYRGRLGFAWVVAPLLAGLVILVAGLVALTR
jgi:hypothetical protein